MYHVSTQGVDERMINVHYCCYYYTVSVDEKHHERKTTPVADPSTETVWRSWLTCICILKLHLYL